MDARTNEAGLVEFVLAKARLMLGRSCLLLASPRECCRAVCTCPYPTINARTVPINCAILKSVGSSLQVRSAPTYYQKGPIT